MTREREGRIGRRLGRAVFKEGCEVVVDGKFLVSDGVLSFANDTTVGFVGSKVGFHHHKCVDGVLGINLAIEVIGVKEVLEVLVGGVERDVFVIEVLENNLGDLKVLDG